MSIITAVAGLFLGVVLTVLFLTLSAPDDAVADVVPAAEPDPDDVDTWLDDAQGKPEPDIKFVPADGKGEHAEAWKQWLAVHGDGFREYIRAERRAGRL